MKTTILALALLAASFAPSFAASAPAGFRTCRDAYVSAPTGWNYPCWALEAFAAGAPGGSAGSSGGSCS